jgi:hypothetical protein
MTIRELIHAELEQLSEAKLQELYVLIRYWLRTETRSNQSDNRFEHFFDQYNAKLNHYRFNREEANER